MLLGPATLVNAVLLVLGVVWCKEIFGRLPREVAEFRGQDWPDRIPSLAIWALTVGVIVWMSRTIWAVATGILSGF